MQNTISQHFSFQKAEQKNHVLTILTRTLSIVFLALFLQGCELDDGTDSYDDDDETIVYSTDDGTTTIDNDNLYEFILRADGTYVVLEDNLSEITIQGDENYLTIDSDTSIDEISITGDNNIITVDDDVDLTITQLNIVGNGNTVTAYGISGFTETSDDDGSENLACETNTGSCL